MNAICMQPKIVYHTIIWICPSICLSANYSAIFGPINPKLGRNNRVYLHSSPNVLHMKIILDEINVHFFWKRVYVYVYEI